MLCRTHESYKTNAETNGKNNYKDKTMLLSTTT